ncbi:hypothetical protein RB614_11090 [Phytohabitans sp. ZYX-F-186]|uniref:Uncharacterized protein n=1 Tax=Phytohabitans maris TaxID=3071409 RepID=A0ABU0ZDD5_9ACTN|nr:hypothetical protein [Phytohabitans sp. ZYX-F-186]MDQ7905066.1 hypothetical protein [Phytohabitans sp. ZYX-F-186]
MLVALADLAAVGTGAAAFHYGVWSGAAENGGVATASRTARRPAPPT